MKAASKHDKTRPVSQKMAIPNIPPEHGTILEDLHEETLNPKPETPKPYMVGVVRASWLEPKTCGANSQLLSGASGFRNFGFRDLGLRA